MRSATKIVLGGAGVVSIFLCIAAALPFLIDLNRFKPHIQRIVAEKANAKIEFSSARLTILSGLGVRLRDVVLENTDPLFAGTRTFAVQELDLRAQLRPLLEKRLVGALVVKEPEIVFATAGLKNNFAALARESAVADSDRVSERSGSERALPGELPHVPGPAPATPEERAETDDLVKRVYFTEIRIENASFLMQERRAGEGLPGAPVKLTDLDILVTNIGVDREVKALVTTSLDVRKEGISVRGPLRFKTLTRVKTSGRDWTDADVRGELSLDAVSVDARGAFVKAAGVPLNLQFEAKLTPQTADFQRFELRLDTLVAKIAAQVRDLKSLDSDIRLWLEEKELSSLRALFPQHRESLPGAWLRIDAGIRGPLSSPNKVTAEARLALALADSELLLEGDLKALSPPTGRLSITSKRFNADQVLGPFLAKESPASGSGSAPPVLASGSSPSPPASAEGTLAAATETPESGAIPAAPAEGFFLSEEQKALLRGSDLAFSMYFGSIVKSGIEIRPLVIDARLRNLSAALREFKLGVFGGNVVMQGIADLERKPLPFSGEAKLNGVMLERIVEMVRPEHKDLLRGKVDLELVASGKGTSLPALTKDLNGKGTFRFLDGELNTASIARIAQQEMDSFLGGLSIVDAAGSLFDAAEKILASPLVAQLGIKPGFDIKQLRTQYEALRKVKVSDKASLDRSLKDVKGNIEIKAGKMHLRTNKAGADGSFAFDGTVALDSSLGGGGVFTASESLKRSMTSQSPYASLLFDERGGLELALALGGKAASPQVAIDWKPIRERFVRNARALVDREVRKKADELVNGALKGKADAALSELKKKQEELRRQAEEEGRVREAELRRKAEEALKKAKEEAQKHGGEKLKKLFGR